MTRLLLLGWCGKYDELIEPPDEINEKYGETIIDIMKNALLDGQSVSMEALNNKGLSPIDRIKVGMKVEVQNIIDPYRYWIATVSKSWIFPPRWHGDGVPSARCGFENLTRCRNRTRASCVSTRHSLTQYQNVRLFLFYLNELLFC